MSCDKYLTTSGFLMKASAQEERVFLRIRTVLAAHHYDGSAGSAQARERLESRHARKNIVRQDHIEASLFYKAKRRLRVLGGGDPAAQCFGDAPGVRELDGVVLYKEDMGATWGSLFFHARTRRAMLSFLRVFQVDQSP